ncbi:hypothetical protein WN943_019594 [Citrus x changshan-huyou]
MQPGLPMTKNLLEKMVKQCKCHEKQRKQAKLLVEENDRLQKHVSQLVCENGYMKQQLRTSSDQVPVEELETVSMGPENPGKTIRIGSRLKEEQKQELVQCLQAHTDVFAWAHEDMPGIDPEVTCHKLAIKKGARAVRQKRRCFNQERYEAINGEVEKLLRAWFIREVNYPEWISNVVLVKKANGKWRMCVDFTNLNKACPKDSFPLPKIDQLVDSIAGHGLLNFMDAFSGYNQIPMYEQDEESTTFITNQGLFCYRVMSFGLKNAGATY